MTSGAERSGSAPDRLSALRARAIAGDRQDDGAMIFRTIPRPPSAISALEALTYFPTMHYDEWNMGRSHFRHVHGSSQGTVVSS